MSQPKFNTTETFIDGNGDIVVIIKISGNKYLCEEVQSGGRYWFSEREINNFGGTDRTAA